MLNEMEVCVLFLFFSFLSQSLMKNVSFLKASEEMKDSCMKTHLWKLVLKSPASLYVNM